MALKTAVDSASILHDLAETCRDREQRYLTARNGITDEDLKDLFGRYASQSEQFRRELGQIVRQRGGDVKEGGSAAGAAFRAWINLKSTLTKADEVSILSECERGEDAALASYHKALGAGLPGGIEAVVGRQASKLEAAHARIKSLRDAAKSDAGA